MKLIIDSPLIIDNYSIDCDDRIQSIEELKDLLKKFSVYHEIYHEMKLYSDSVYIEVFEQTVTLDEIDMNTLLSVIDDYWDIKLTYVSQGDGLECKFYLDLV